MSDIPFYRTQMGHRFYESTAPSLVRELARLNDNIERLLELLDRYGRHAEAEPSGDSGQEQRR